MKTVLAEDLFTVSGLLTADECRTLIERGEGIGFQQASVRTTGGPQMMTNIRNNDRAEFRDAALGGDLYERCRPFLPDEMEGGKPLGLDDFFRFYRYDVGQRFKRHKDGVVERSPTVRSRLSCLFYLNGGFTGGETAFYAFEQIGGVRQEVACVAPRAGDVLFFRHDWWHEGRELVEGRKYVLRSDVFFQFPEAPPA